MRLLISLFARDLLEEKKLLSTGRSFLSMSPLAPLCLLLVFPAISQKPWSSAEGSRSNMHSKCLCNLFVQM